MVKSKRSIIDRVLDRARAAPDFATDSVDGFPCSFRRVFRLHPAKKGSCYVFLTIRWNLRHLCRDQHPNLADQ